MIQDCGEVVVKCYNCHKAIFTYRIFEPNIDKINKLSFNCPFCHEKQPQLEICGRYWLGPISQEESKYPTVINEIININNNEFSLNMIKR